MSNKYDDIIDLPHYQSKKRAQMTMMQRAAQFAPFAALSGYDESIAEAARLTYSRLELSEDELATLSARLLRAVAHEPRPTVTITHFVPDIFKAGGEYRKVTGVVRTIEKEYNSLTVTTLTPTGNRHDVTINLDMISRIDLTPSI